MKNEANTPSHATASEGDAPQQVPSINRPWEPFWRRARRMKVLSRDLAKHRMYHSLYEDMLN